MSEGRRRARLQDIAGIAQSLRDPIDAPDLTKSILERVHEERPFMAPRTRQWVPIARISSIAAALAVVFGLTLIVFVRPDLPEQLGGPKSVTTDLVESTEQGLAKRFETLRSSVVALQNVTDKQIFNPVLKDMEGAANLVASPSPAEPVASATDPLYSTLEYSGPSASDSLPMYASTMNADGQVSDFGGLSGANGAMSFVGNQFTSGKFGSGQGVVVPVQLTGWGLGAKFRQVRVNPANFVSSSSRSVNPGSQSWVNHLGTFLGGQPGGDDSVPR